MNSLKSVVVLMGVLMLVLAACSSGSNGDSTSAPAAPVAPLSTVLNGVPGIVDPTNTGWPRTVDVLNGLVTIDAKPERILTVSLGHDEVTYAMVPASRVVATGSYTKLAQHSNVAHLAEAVGAITLDAEQVVSYNPDLVIASPFTKADFIDALRNVGIPVVQTKLHNDPDGRIQDIILLGYVYGEVDRALELADEVRARYDALREVTGSKPVSDRQRVLSLTSYSDKIYTAGANSTEGGIIEAADGINVAALAGLDGNPTTSLEGVISMAPEVIFIPQPPDSGEPFREQLLANPALAEVPAIKNGRVYVVPNKFFTTLSFWNLRGAEHLALLLWPDDFNSGEFVGFSFPE
ncbi:MAG: ABC transporter substrate-binding protein [SAR202 cluster bacterium]|nr:ABC transporter substrate-binding protein [SAR202 cluster bacterium]|tara:strand:+ start:413 stop:1462 length:1050 start_codon:yes stop_codon:yes gene_type:complete